MFKIIIKGLKNNTTEEIKFDAMSFDRQELIDNLADLTSILIERNLLSSSRIPDEKIKIYFQFDDQELLLCHYNGRLLCDLTTDLIDYRSIQHLDYLSHDYGDAYDLIEQIVTHEYSDYIDTTMNELYAALDKIADEIEYEDGSIYKGDTIEGQPHGHGSMRWPDGSSYEGDWLGGMHHGHGIYIWPDGGEYNGEWKKGKMHGAGIMRYASGKIFQGFFHEGEIFMNESTIGKWSDREKS